MKLRKVTAGLVLTAFALAPGFLAAQPAAAQDQTTKDKDAKHKGQTMTLISYRSPCSRPSIRQHRAVRSARSSRRLGAARRSTWPRSPTRAARSAMSVSTMTAR